MFNSISNWWYGNSKDKTEMKNIILIVDDVYVDNNLYKFNEYIIKNFNLQECCSFNLKYLNSKNEESNREMKIYSTEKKYDRKCWCHYF